MKVDVAEPEVSGDLVTYKWTQSKPNPFQRDNQFSFRYEGVDLTSVSTDLLMEIFLGLQLRVFAGLGEPVQLNFASPVRSSSAAYWSAFFEVENVEIEPVIDLTGYSPWSAKPAPRPKSKHAAVFFGGGKDSMLAACLLAEMHGADQVLLIQYVGPVRPDRRLRAKLEARQERLMLERARERLGMATQRVWSDYQAQFLPAGYHLRPNMELYTVGSLPVLLAHRVAVSAFSLDWLFYPIVKRPGKAPRYGYRSVRPEALALQSRHFQRNLEIPVSLTNITMPLNSYGTYRLLALRYPDAAAQIVMCTKAPIDRRWCHNCHKCAIFAMLSLACGTVDPDFDYDRFLTSSWFIHDVTEHAKTGPESGQFGNAPWIDLLCDPRDVIIVFHLLAIIDLNALNVELSIDALTNLALLKALWGNTRFPEHDLALAELIDLVGQVVGPRFAEILRDHFETIDRIPQPLRVGNETVEFDFSPNLSPTLALLESTLA